MGLKVSKKKSDVKSNLTVLKNNLEHSENAINTTSLIFDSNLNNLTNSTSQLSRTSNETQFYTARSQLFTCSNSTSISSFETDNSNYQTARSHLSTLSEFKPDNVLISSCNSLSTFEGIQTDFDEDENEVPPLNDDESNDSNELRIVEVVSEKNENDVPKSAPPLKDLLSVDQDIIDANLDYFRKFFQPIKKGFYYSPTTLTTYYSAAKTSNLTTATPPKAWVNYYPPGRKDPLQQKYIPVSFNLIQSLVREPYFAKNKVFLKLAREHAENLNENVEENLEDNLEANLEENPEEENDNNEKEDSSEESFVGAHTTPKYLEVFLPASFSNPPELPVDLSANSSEVSIPLELTSQHSQPSEPQPQQTLTTSIITPKTATFLSRAITKTTLFFWVSSPSDRSDLTQEILARSPPNIGLYSTLIWLAQLLHYIGIYYFFGRAPGNEWDEVGRYHVCERSQLWRYLTYNFVSPQSLWAGPFYNTLAYLLLALPLETLYGGHFLASTYLACILASSASVSVLTPTQALYPGEPYFRALLGATVTHVIVANYFVEATPLMILSLRHWIFLACISASLLYQSFYLTESWALGDLLSTLAGLTTSGHYFRLYSRYSSFDELDIVRGEFLKGVHFITFALILTSFSVHMHFPRMHTQYANNATWCQVWDDEWIANWNRDSINGPFLL